MNLIVNEEHPETYRETFRLSRLKKSIARMPGELKSREEKAVKFENVNSALRAKKLLLKYNQLKLLHNGEANYSNNKMKNQYQCFIRIQRKR